MGLDALLNRMQSRESVTPVTPCYTDGVTVKPASNKACTPVTSVTPQNINSESDNETYTQIPEESAACGVGVNFSPISVKTQDIGDWENFINWWLDHIGERDPELRNVCLNQCRRDDEARRYFLSHAILEVREACPGQT